MVFGASGTYKSFFMLAHAMRLATNGIHVLYIAAEGEYGYRQRLEADILHHKQKPSTITFVLGQVDLFDVEESADFTRLIEAYKPQMIVVDTFAMCSGMGDENNTRDMLTIVNGCKMMSKTLNAVSWWFTIPMPKAGKSVGTRFYATPATRFCASVWKMIRFACNRRKPKIPNLLKPIISPCSSSSLGTRIILARR
jgi:hypothetical protein